MSKIPTFRHPVPMLKTTPAPSRRIRGRRLQTLRALHLAEYPLCVHCLRKTPPRTTVATELDHVVPLHLGGVESRDPFTNRQGLCLACHEEKSAREERSRASGGRDER